MEKKPCLKCNIIKNTSDFSKNKTRKDYLCAYCKKCDYERSKDYIAKNKEKVREYFREYNKKNKEKISEYRKNWNQKNPDVMRNVCRTRRARKRANTKNPPTIKQINDRMIFCGSKCVYCHNPFTQVDHVIALKKGGTDDIHNLVPSCQKCNFSKQASDWRIWFKKQLFYSIKKERFILDLIKPCESQQSLDPTLLDSAYI